MKPIVLFSWFALRFERLIFSQHANEWRRRSTALPSVVLLVLSGCASPHRTGVSTHRIEVFRGRVDGLVSREEWRDSERGGGLFLFTDPTVQSMSATHTNQAALGGGSAFVAGPMAVALDTNTAAVVGAGGAAIGNVIGAAVKSAVK